MIFATVGTQLPFPRLIHLLDKLAQRHQLTIFAQTADPACQALNIHHQPFLRPREFKDRFENAELIVGHAGIGTILTAKKLRKPLVLMPRRAEAGEHRNDHQMATARAMEASVGLYVAWSAADLEGYLTSRTLEPASLDESERRTALISLLQNFVSTE